MARRKQTALERYCRSILSGKTVACAKMRKLAERLLADIRNRKGRWVFDPELAERPVRFIEEFCKVPSGRIGRPLVLEDYEKAWIETIFGFVDRKTRLRRYTESFICVARKNGKALSLDTEIPTPDGWVRMGDVHEGDLVFGRDGKPTRVLHESPIFDKPMYEVAFEDGTTVKASADHVWTVKTKSRARLGSYRPKTSMRRTAWEKTRHGGWFETTTEQMAGDFARARADGKGTEYKYRVPMNEPVEYPERELPVDPYTLGAWLGDGVSTKPEITMGREDERDMVRNIVSRGHVVKVAHYEPGKAAQAFIDYTGRGKASRSDKTFRSAIKKMGLLGNKHIPREYMESSVEQRWELLRGLMDTDGYCSKAGQCEFTQKSERLATQVCELVRSLGIKATIKPKEATCNGKPAGTVYRVQFFTDADHCCFTLKRKASRLKPRLADRMNAKSIVGIRRIPNEPSKCIMVDNDDHLYLASRGYTATHNSSLAAAVELYMLSADGEGAPQVINAANNLDQANLSYSAAIRMVRQSGDIARHVHKQEDRLYCDLNMGYIKPMAANASTLDGLDVHMAVIDEIHAAKTRDVYDLMKQATAAREQPLVFTITTNGFVRNSVFDAQYDYARRWLDGELEDERFVAFIYELDDRSEWEDESCWMKANPGLGTVKSVEYLRGQVAKAKEDPAYRPTVLTKDFNMPENASIAWLTFDEAVNDATFDMAEMGFRYGICGFDASDTTDLTSAQMLMMRPDDERIYEASMYWLPEETVMAADGRNDRDGAPYRLWIARGLMRTVPGNKVDKRVLLEWLLEMRDEHDVYPYAVCVDPWHMDDSTLRDLELLVGKGRVLKIRQGALTLSEPMKRIRADYRANRIVDNHNPVNEWCRMNVAVKADVNLNIQPDKKGMNPKNRIDGFAAELDAYVGLQNLMADYLQVV